MTQIAFYLSHLNKNDDTQNIPRTVDLCVNECQKQLEPFLKFVNQMLDAENLIVLAGSGTSLTFNEETKKIAPSMGDLWESCKNLAPFLFSEVLAAVNYEEVAGTWEDGTQKNDIELLLSLCDAYIPLKNLDENQQTKVTSFLKQAKDKILEETSFVHNVPTDKWVTHNNFLRTLGRRSPKQKRLKIFTTNYDLAFEVAASNTGQIIIDGFEFSKPQRFNPSWYNYDIINRSQASEKGGAYLPNVVHLYKLHGSVDWAKTNKGVYKKDSLTTEEIEPVFIYPSSTKYQSSYDSPYLDMMAAFLEAMQKPKTAVLCIGFGFNDKHINNAITMALRTNPELMVMVATKDPFNEKGSFNSDTRTQFINAINSGDSRIALVDCAFDVFTELLPNRHIPSPEESLLAMFEQVISQGGDNA